MPSTSGSYNTSAANSFPVITIESVIGETIVIQGISNLTVNGLDDNSTSINCLHFTNRIVEVYLGGLLLSNINPNNGFGYIQKDYNSNTISLVNITLHDGDLIKIKIL